MVDYWTSVDWIQEWRNPLLNFVFMIITQFGHGAILAAIGILLWKYVDRDLGGRFLLILITVAIMSGWLKSSFSDPRPPSELWLNPWATTLSKSDSGWGLPSGHSMAAVACWGLVAIYTKKPWMKRCSLSLCLLVPVSRIWLGVHDPQDVVVGSMVGGGILFGWIGFSETTLGKEISVGSWKLHGLLAIAAIGDMGIVWWLTAEWNGVKQLLLWGPVLVFVSILLAYNKEFEQQNSSHLDEE